VSCGTLRFLAVDELADLLSRAGLRIEVLLGGFDGRPFNHDSPEIIHNRQGTN
jgi:hypothetical protein